MQAEVYFRSNCPFCVRAKKLLETRGVDFTEIEVDEATRETLMERVITATKSTEAPNGIPPRTVPQIFLDGEYIGGFDALDAYFKRKDVEADDGA